MAININKLIENRDIKFGTKVKTKSGKIGIFLGRFAGSFEVFFEIKNLGNERVFYKDDGEISGMYKGIYSKENYNKHFTGLEISEILL